MKKYKTAIVILNWNGESLLRQFLPSIIENSKLADVGIIVADNGSDDLSIQVLKDEFPEVKLLELETNYGFARGYNEALTRIEAEYYVLLNSDVEVTANWLEPALKLFEENDDIAVIQPKILSYNQKQYFEYAGAAGGYIDRYGFPFCRGRILDEIEEDKGQYDQQTDIFWGSGACMFVRAGLFHKAGRLDADFWAHMEEIDLCWRLKNMGYRIVYCPDSKVYHLGGASLPYNNPKKLFLNFRNNLFLLYKNLPTRCLLPILFSRMIMDGAAAFKLLTEGNRNGFKSVIQAHLSFYGMLFKLQDKRRLQRKLVQRKFHPEMYRGSVAWQHYIKKLKYFNELKF